MIPLFVKELKGGFAQWYNRKYNRYGALWAERFKSVLLEAGRALATVVAYVSLNPGPKFTSLPGYRSALRRSSILRYLARQSNI
jgi:hypothetical protein